MSKLVIGQIALLDVDFVDQVRVVLLDLVHVACDYGHAFDAYSREDARNPIGILLPFVIGLNTNHSCSGPTKVLVYIVTWYAGVCGVCCACE